MTEIHSAANDLMLRGAVGPIDCNEHEWEQILRLARMSGLHGRLAVNNGQNPLLSAPVRRHLLSAGRVAAFRSQMLRAELFHLAPLCDRDFPVVLLKGGAYLAQQLHLATGRFVSDVDLLVPRAHLDTMEQRLRAGGWQAVELTAYDERYYRDWSHETPPFRRPGHFLEVDLHHAITPVTGSLSFDPAPLLEASIPLADTPFRVLCAEDQVLHACLHCFHDGDLALRVREVVDIDGLLRTFSQEKGFWDRLVRRASQLGLERPLWYGLHFAHRWLDCPVPASVPKSLSGTPSRITQRYMDTFAPLALLPSNPDTPVPLHVQLARNLMLTRYHLLRMPLRLLLPHLMRKAGRRLQSRLSQKSIRAGV